MFEYLFEKLNKFYENLFYRYGLFISKYYVYTIVISFLINVLLSLGLLKIHLITNSDELYSVIDSQAKNDEKLLKSLFINDDFYEKKFYVHQLVDFGTWAEINFHVRHDIADKNIVNRTYFDEIKMVNDIILNNVTINGNITFKDVCAKNFGKCVIDGVDLLSDDFFVWLKEKVEQVRLKEALNSNLNINHTSLSSTLNHHHQQQSYDYLSQDTIYIRAPSVTDLKFALGKHFKFITINQTNSKTQDAFATVFKLRYALNSDYENLNEIVKLWEFEFLNLINKIDLKYLSFTYATSQSLEIEMLNNIKFDIVLIGATFTLITLFATLLMSFKSNLITSPGIILPFTGILSATFACTSSIGVISLLNYPACNLIFVIPFLVLGIGIDDMFIIYSSFMYTSQDLKTSERISNALKKAGVSITITSLTDFIAFIVGISASFKSVKIFCLYAAFSILFCYFYQLTFFCGWLVVHSNRIQSKRNTFLWCIKYKEEQKQNGSDNVGDEQNIELNKINTNVQNGHQNCNTSSQQINTRSNNRRRTHEARIITFLDNFYKIIEKYWTKLYKCLLYKKTGKLIVFGIFLIYISIFSLNASKINEGIDVGDLVADDSYFRAYIQDNIKSIDMFPVVMLTVYKPIDYTNKTIKAKINSLINEAKKINGINKNFDFNWMNMYEQQLKKYKKSNKTNDSYLLQIRNDDLPFSNDVVLGFNNLTQKYEIIASRFYIRYNYLHFNSKDAIPMNQLRDLCLNSDLPIIPYAVTFKFYEQFEQTMPNVIQAFVIAIEAMYLISLIFIPDLISTLCIVFSMISIMIGLVGCMNLWNLTLSSVTMIQLVMSVGFCVDFSAHLTHAFIASTGKGSRNERAYKASMRTGLPIFNSALSTIIGVCTLAFCRSYIFLSFFKTMFIVMTLGVLNSMLFLPVLLSLVGPHWSRHKDNKLAKNSQTNNDTTQIKKETSNTITNLD